MKVVKMFILSMALVALCLQGYMFYEEKKKEAFDKEVEEAIEKMGGLEKPVIIYDKQGNVYGKFETSESLERND